MVKKIFILSIFLMLNLQLFSQEVRFSAGFDLLYSPDISPEFKYFSQTFSLSYKHEVWNKFNLGIKYRYLSIAGNFPWPKGDNIEIHNLDSNAPKVLEYDAFNKGFYTKGRSARRWGEHSRTIGVFLNKDFNLGNKFELGLSTGAFIELYKLNGILLVVHNGELTTPEKEVLLVDTYLFQTLSAWYITINSEIYFSYRFTKSTAIGLSAEFIYDINSAGYFPIDLFLTYKF